MLISIQLFNVTVPNQFQYFKAKLSGNSQYFAFFLGSTQEAHMCATCVLPSVASLMGRSVSKLEFFSQTQHDLSSSDS